MTAVELKIDPKRRAGNHAVDRANRRILSVVMGKLRKGEITKSELARKLGLDRSAISRLLRGNQNLTARTMGELLWALDHEFDITTKSTRTDRANNPGD